MQSGVEGHHHSGVDDNTIKNVVIIARTAMIHAALRWPDASENSLFPMAMYHYVCLHNHSTYIYSGMSPEEFWTRSKYYNSALHNAHIWGCPTYLMEPRLKYGNEFTKWIPRYRRSQYLGAYPLHSSTVGLVRNLQTGNTSPNFT